MNFERLEEIAFALYDHEHPLRTFHVSFILQRRKILSIGINNVKTHPVNLLNPKFDNQGQVFSDKGTCSELNAISKLIRQTRVNTEICSLVNIRIDKNGKLNHSAPCLSCQSLIAHHGFKKVFFTNENGRFQNYDTKS